MKKLALAVAIALATTSAQAVLVCKNSKQQQVEWHAGKGRPDLTKFDVEAQGIVCFASNRAGEYIGYMNVPFVPGMPTALPRDQAPGQIYRGDLARFVLENIGTIEDAFAFESDFTAAKP